MKSILSYSIVVAVFYSALAAQEDRQNSVSVIPIPQSISVHHGSFRITSSVKIVLGDNSKEEQWTASQLNTELAERTSMQLKVVSERSLRKLPAEYLYIGGTASDHGKQIIKDRKIVFSSEMKAEGYYLDVSPTGIVILAESERGKFYGMMTLLQLIRQDKRKLFLPAVTILDYPLQKFRGISDDISRGQISTVMNFKKIIRFLARYKINVYSPYFEDTFAFTKYPELAAGRGALTAAECKELDEYAAMHWIEVIPIFETLGHWENILLKPEYVQYAEFPGAHTINISDEKVYGMLDDMLKELASSFSSPYVNMAADESRDVGLGFNKQRVAQSDLATVHAEHYQRVIDILKKYSKRPMMYGDIILNLPAILEKIPKDVVIVDWHYGAAPMYPSASVFSKAGFPFIASPAVWNFTGPFPNYLNTFVNVRNFNREGYENGALGLLTSSWNDHGGEALRELNYYGYGWSAECSWNPLKANAVEFDRSFFNIFFGYDGPEMQSVYALLSDPANQYQWNELWRHPLNLPREGERSEQKPPVLIRAQSISSLMPFVLSQLASAKTKITRNADQIPYLRFIAQMNLWFAKKIEAQSQLLKLKRSIDSGSELKQQTAEAESLCLDVIKDLHLLRSEFERLWITTNKLEGFELLQRRYERQMAYWQEIADQLHNGKLDFDVSIESDWIYHPLANPGKRDTVQVRSALFQKVFTAPHPLRSAVLQLIGDTHTKLWVNGKYLGEVYARRSLSLIVENERIKIFDLFPYLSDSSNVITVEAKNYSPFGSAGVNVYAELQSTDGQVHKVMSDSTWKVTSEPVANFHHSVPSDSTWQTASPRPYPAFIVKPNFAISRKSWIE